MIKFIVRTMLVFIGCSLTQIVTSVQVKRVILIPKPMLLLYVHLGGKVCRLKTLP